MAEKEAFHQFCRDGAAIHRDKAVRGAEAETMDEPGKEFLAGAGLPQDEDGNLRRGQQGARFQRLENAWVVADNAALPDGRLQVRRRQVGNLGGTRELRTTGKPGRVRSISSRRGRSTVTNLGGRIWSSVAGSSPPAASSSQQACICGVPEATEMKYRAIVCAVTISWECRRKKVRISR